jgi:mRNA-degrading endonuclease YafQ of YafQ-DinJ toxin-antitoxin module
LLRPQIKTLQYKDKFARDLKALPIDVQLAVKEAIADLLRDPIPASRRLHPLTGFKNPKVYTVDVFTNHSYKISLEMEGHTATLRRVATHKIIDDRP